MTFFQGHEIYSIDSKGRLSIPARMRKAMSPKANDTLTLTRGYKQCISAYPNDEWAKIQKILYTKNQFDEDNDYVFTLMLMWCTEVQLDSQQRIVIPKKLLDFAGLVPDSKALLLGKLDHIEIWNQQIFENYLESKKEPYESIVSKVMKDVTVVKDE